MIFFKFYKNQKKILENFEKNYKILKKLKNIRKNNFFIKNKKI